MGAPAQKLTKAVTAYLDARGVYYWRNSSGGMYTGTADGRGRYVRFGQPGVSDLCALVNGRFFAIEIKAGKDTLRPAQVRFLEQIEAAGGVAVVARSVEDVANAVEIFLSPLTLKGLLS